LNEELEERHGLAFMNRKAAYRDGTRRRRRKGKRFFLLRVNMINVRLPTIFAIEEEQEAAGFFNNIVTRVTSVYRGSHSSPVSGDAGRGRCFSALMMLFSLEGSMEG
jgi:hypothetical protein